MIWRLLALVSSTTTLLVFGALGITRPAHNHLLHRTEAAFHLYDAERGIDITLRNLPTGTVDVAWEADTDRLATTQRARAEHTFSEYDPFTGATRPLVIYDRVGAAAWSDDHTRLAYVRQSMHSLDKRLYMFEFPVGIAREVVIAGGVGRILWAPVGDRLAFLGRIDSASDLYLVQPGDVGPYDLINLTQTPGRTEHQPTWSPDGAFIYFLDPHGGLYRVRTDGSGITETLSEGVAGVRFCLSADGATVAVTGAEGVFLVDAGASRQVYPVQGRALGFSPSGDRLAFFAEEAGGVRELVVVELATGAVTEIASPQARDATPHLQWSPDGAWLAYQNVLPTGVPGQVEPAAYVVRADMAAAPVRLAAGEDVIGWRP